MGFPPKDARDLESYTARLPKADIAEAKGLAPRLGITVSELMRRALAELLERHRDPVSRDTETSDG